MLPVSNEFLEKVKAGRRNIKARVEVVWTDTQIDESIRISANEEARTSWNYQVADAVDNTAHKWASLDGSWKLDGSYHLAPGSREVADDYQMGWWGKQLSDQNGEFSEPYPTLTVSFFERPVYSFKVVGDSERGEYPVDFDIKNYSNGDLVYTEEIRGNNEVFFRRKPSVSLDAITRMEIVIYKWSHSGRQTKILELFSSVRRIYEDDDILQLNLLEERELSEGSLPIGNVSANELDIRLNNINRDFFAGNEDSALFGLIKKNRRIRAWLGIEIEEGLVEYQPLGVFWSGDWSAPEQEVYAETTARDRLQLMDESDFETSKVIENTDLYELAKIVFEDYELDEEKYWIDDELKEFEIPYGYFEPMSHREALRMIAEACVGQVYADRNGIVRVEGPSFIENEYQVIGE